MATLSIKDVRKSYGSVQVLHGVDIELEDGGFLVLLGPSGCGKSTLLNMIAGLDDTSGGDILIGGRSVVDLAPKDRNIAMVFQSYALYPTMSVARNIGFGLEMRGVDADKRKGAVEDAARLLQISHLLDRRPANLSGGQRQRVAMGRAIVRDPELFLFDEPLSNLDAKLRVEMRTEIKRLHERLGTSIVYVTHDQIEAMTLGTKVAVMKGGYIQQLADPRTVYERPANMFVASFIGSPAMNFLPGQLVREAGGVRFEASGVSIAMPARKPAEISERPVILGMRPEELKVAARDQASVTGVIDVVEPTGPETMVTVQVGDRSVIARVPPRFAGQRNETIFFTVDPASINLFDPDTEQRIDI
ncbi:sn-glycerol-3-phosphate ABC transporter ATP-binding protein UgpC [Mesorhizobium sp.]|uniref:ABC transporter ATP-binding protein n=1 Tax=Mesorhizobium sp. TaxID=1871066 RepID=UPI0011FE2D8A|nr:sn-glycerol-3-phosphate ABC transporter ATP-binding protein UgpC [Mesorhizobium sp.]TIO05411.1 MAG: sn-glycerol-3-phosphate ABC transporter ATP-binding protein UgpC [Mesorhizobium sp.]TIO33061.1 MAG: sn-glycerol-3-phosphate ABC transporter ATP-binding protein UgpC [Mesorhizobium sp.]TIP14952.1 MAG: sn-glycerol-3-phosphate ABC transporter ATP-binding protein UgpC [Mesorhizobium sp.]